MTTSLDRDPFLIDKLEASHSFPAAVSISCSSSSLESEDDEEEDDYQWRHDSNKSMPCKSHEQLFSFREIRRADRDRIKELHEEWFPVVYQDEFYDDLCENHLGGTPLFTCVATRLNPQQQQWDEEEGSSERDNIVGCVVGSFMPASRLSPSLQHTLLSDRQQYKNLFYIMTLGTVPSCRKLGLGTTLVGKCIEEVEKDPSCGVLYLHVITFNEAAIQLYEKMGFQRVEEIENYYDIKGKKFPCYLYAKYCHGNQGRPDVYRLLVRTIRSLWKQVIQFASVRVGVLDEATL